MLTFFHDMLGNSGPSGLLQSIRGRYRRVGEKCSCPVLSRGVHSLLLVSQKERLTRQHEHESSGQPNASVRAFMWCLGLVRHLAATPVTPWVEKVESHATAFAAEHGKCAMVMARAVNFGRCRVLTWRRNGRETLSTLYNRLMFSPWRRWDAPCTPDRQAS